MWFRAGTILGPSGVQIDLAHTSGTGDDFDDWVTIKSDSDRSAEDIAGRVLAALNTPDKEAMTA